MAVVETVLDEFHPASCVCCLQLNDSLLLHHAIVCSHDKESGVWRVDIGEVDSVLANMVDLI